MESSRLIYWLIIPFLVLCFWVANAQEYNVGTHRPRAAAGGLVYTEGFEDDSDPNGSGDTTCSEISPESVGVGGFNCDYSADANNVIEGTESARIWGTDRGIVKKPDGWTGTEEQCLEVKINIEAEGATSDTYILRLFDPNANVTYELDLTRTTNQLRMTCGGSVDGAYSPNYVEGTAHTIQIRMDHSDPNGRSSGSFNVDGGGFTTCTGSAAFPAYTSGYLLRNGSGTMELFYDGFRATTGSQTCL
jgi:hypothetical protein